MHGLIAVTMMAGLFSLLGAAFFMRMDAVDVAFTEASVGAGITTVLLLGTLAIVGSTEKDNKSIHWPSIVLVLFTGAMLIYATLDMPLFGSADAPVHQHEIAKHYIEESYHEIHVDNLVTAVLGSYRGYDTFGEVTVIFTAAIGVLALLYNEKKKKKEDT